LALRARRSLRGTDRQPARTVVVHRARGVQGGLRVWACSITRPPRHGERRCTARIRLRSVARLKLRAWMRGRVRVVVERTRRHDR
ncbi:MAG: hypothetical protein ACRDLV_14805, partial [Solirubrobacteraceae bacterium]